MLDSTGFIFIFILILFYCIVLYFILFVLGWIVRFSIFLLLRLVTPEHHRGDAPSHAPSHVGICPELNPLAHHVPLELDPAGFNL